MPSSTAVPGNARTSPCAAGPSTNRTSAGPGVRDAGGRAAVLYRRLHRSITVAALRDPELM